MLAAAALAGAAVPLLGAGAAQASTSGGCESATVQYRIVDADGKVVGADWTSQGGFHQWSTAPATVEVRLAAGQTVGDGCTYPVSLAQYTAEGPDWGSSGHQALVAKDTVHLTAEDVAGSDDAGRTWQKLSVRTPDCYGQIDLYGDDVTYDGGAGEGHGPLPYQPGNVNTPYHLIAAWNGGDKACAAGSSTPTADQSAPAASATPTAPAGSSTAPAAGTTSPATTAKPKPTSTPTTTSDVPPLETTPSAGAAPSAEGGKKPLAETGAGAPLGTIAAAAAAVLAAGAGAVYLSRRRRA